MFLVMLANAYDINLLLVWEITKTAHTMSEMAHA